MKKNKKKLHIQCYNMSTFYLDVLKEFSDKYFNCKMNFNCIYLDSINC